MTEESSTEVFDENELIAQRKEKLSKIRENGIAFPNDLFVCLGYCSYHSVNAALHTQPNVRL